MPAARHCTDGSQMCCIDRATDKGESRMEAKRRTLLHMGFFFLGLWVGADTAQAKESRIKVARDVEIYVADLPSGEVEVSVRSPLTGGHRQIMGPALSADVRAGHRMEKDGPFLLPAVVGGGIDITILVWETGHFAYLPVRYDKTLEIQWATRSLSGEHYVISSVKSEHRQGTFLSKISTNSTVVLDVFAHDIFTSERFYVHLFGDGTLWLPASGASFDVNHMESDEIRRKDGKLLSAVTMKDIERFRKMHEQSGTEAPFGSAFAFEPGKDMTVIWHPIWARMGHGKQGADPQGGMTPFLNNLGRLLWAMDHAPEEKEAAQAAFRLFVGEEVIRRDLNLSEGTPLEVEDYRDYVKKKRAEWKNLQEGKAHQRREPPDWWVTRTPFWRILKAEDSTPEKFERLAGALSSSDPVDREIAQAAARMLMGGERGVRQYSESKAIELTDADYKKAALARAHFSRVVLARMSLEPWLEARSMSEAYWWTSLAQVIQLRPSPAMTDAAIEIVERKLGSKQAVAKLLGKTEPLVTADYLRVARQMGQNHIPENYAGFCQRVLQLENAQPPHINLN